MSVESLKDNSKLQHGGARVGAGRPKGLANKATIDRAVAKQRMIDRIHGNVDRLINAQLGKAFGETYLMCQRTIGKGSKQHRETEIVTDPEIIRQFLDDELEYDQYIEYYYMTTKPADNFAIQGLLDRGFGKADSKVENSGEQKIIVETRKTPEVHADNPD